MTTTQRKIGSSFGPQSTAAEVLDGIDLTGHTAIVTGGYSGLGLEITRALTDAGANVIVPARRPSVASAALRGIPLTEVPAMDLGDLASIRGFAHNFLSTGRRLDIVINNAGIMACPETRIGPGREAQFAINHLGHFALVNELAPSLTHPNARVVAVSSSGHFQSPIRWNDLHFQNGYDRWLAYAQSKTANALFAVHLNTLGESIGLRAFSAHPGQIITPLQRHIPRDEQIALGWISPDGEPNPDFKTPPQGAATAVWAATSPLLDEHGGTYLQDCDIAEIATTDDMSIGGVKPWAINPDDAARLWNLSATLTGTDGFTTPSATRPLFTR